jgi:hypothetical protein
MEMMMHDVATVEVEDREIAAIEATARAAFDAAC